MLNVETFRDLTLEAHSRFGGRAFLSDDPALGTLSYSELFAFARGLEAKLHQLGVPVGAPVATIFHNCGIAALLFMAIIASRRVLVPLNPAAPEDECEYMLSRAGCVAVIADPSHARSVNYGDRIFQSVVHHRRYFEEVCEASGDVRPELVGSSSLGGEIVFTSGSTGRPKGVVLSERNLLSNAMAIGRAYGFSAGHRFLTVCPL